MMRKGFAVRAGWIWLHKWTGLVLGANLALIGLTGSVIVFYREIDTVLNPDFYAAAPNKPPLPAAEILRVANAAAPDPVLSLITPDPVQPVWIALRVRDGDFWFTTIDPGTGKVLGTRDFDRSLAFMIYRLHSRLLLRHWWGDEMVGVLGIILLLSAGSGLYIWWPKRDFWRALVTIRKKPRQILYRDLHNVAGVWVSAILLAISFTGVAVVFPGLVRPLVNIFSAVRPDPAPVSTDQGRPYAISIDAAIAIALARVPGTVATTINVAQAPDNIWSIGLRPQGSDPAIRGVFELWVDPWTGEIVDNRAPGTATAGERFMALQLWLHNGSLFGWTGRTLVFLSGWVLPLLFVSGVLLWLRKRGARRELDQRRALRCAGGPVKTQFDKIQRRLLSHRERRP